MSKFALNTLKFEDIKQQLIDYLKEKNEYSGQFDFTNSNIGYFVDTMSYITMLMSYNTTHVANNVFLDTTDIRKNAVSIAKQIGYKPKRPYPAKFQGKLIYKGVNFNKNSRLVINSRSPFVGSLGNIYTNLKPIILTYKGNPTQLEGEYVLTEGVFKKYKTQNIQGIANYTFTLNNKNVSESEFSLYVIPSYLTEYSGFDEADLSNYSQYKWELAFPFAIPTTSRTVYDTPIYFMEEDILSEGFPKITFGNNTIGKIPTSSETIVCEFLETQGADANNENLVSLPTMDLIAGSSNTYLYYDISYLGEENKNIFSTSNFDNLYKNKYNKSFGGSDLETLNDIKFNAPKFYSFVGRCVTKNDYTYYLSSFPEIKSINVIGANEIYPNDVTKLGIIFITAVPNLDTTEFLSSPSIYLSADMINDIKYKLDYISIISTKRQFFKPSYIYVDVLPTLEFDKSTPISEKNKTYKLVKSMLQKFTNDNFNDLGVRFRESKLSAVIDNIQSIISSYLNLTYYIIINDQTVLNMVEGQSNFIYIPTISIKNQYDEVTGTTKFVKTNIDIIKEEILPTIDWRILNNVPITTEQKTEFSNKIKLLNNALLNLPPELSSIYSKIIHPILNREVYSRDYKDQNVISIWFVENVLYSNGYSFLDRNGNKVTVDIEISGETKYLRFSLYEEEFGQINFYRVGIINVITNPYSIFITMTTEHNANLLEHFGIDTSNYVFDGLPFNIIQTKDLKFEIQMRMISYTSQFVLRGQNKIFDLYKISANTSNEIILDKNMLPSWIFEHQVGENHALIKYNNTTIAYFERSHNELLTANKKFKGFLFNENDYDNMMSVNSAVGDYYIVQDFFYKEINDTYTFFNKNDVLFKNFNNEFEKASIKKLVTADSPDNLITRYKQGDLYIYQTGYIMFDEYSESTVTPDFTVVDVYPVTKSLDVSKFLPTALQNNHLLRILIPDEVYSVGGYFVYYADGITHKLEKPLYVKNSLGSWEEIITKKLYDGDIIIYSNSNSVHIDGGWYLLENLLDVAEAPEANARLSVRADDISTIDYLNSLKSFMRVLRIDVEAITISSGQLSMFENPPEDSVLTYGDLLICIDPILNKWKVYDDDYYTFHFDILNNNTAFPEVLNYGTLFNVKVSNIDIKNFRGMTGSITFEEDEKILYYNDGLWKKFVTPTISYSSLPAERASLGDMVRIISESGNFQNTNLIDCVKYNDNFLFNYNDILYYTGSKWIKLFPYNVYNDMTNDGIHFINRRLLNDLGYNSDFRIDYKSINTFDVYLDDIYNNALLGEIDYYSGRIALNNIIDGEYNKIDKVTDEESKSIGAIFKSSNYADIPIKMDKIKLKPITNADGKEETDFDTNFSQYIVCSIQEAVI